jgi:hypothetical protein
MKRTLAVIAACMFMTSAALAEESHDHSGQAEPPAAKHGMPMGGMHEHMKKMREQMAQIRAAREPKERERLMAEHMSTMEQSMAKMQGMGCGKM